MWYVITSAVTIVKSREKECLNYFPMTISLRCIVKCGRNLDFEKMGTAPSQEKMMGFDYCEEYLRSTSNKVLLRQC